MARAGKHRKPVTLVSLDGQPAVHVDSRDFEPMIALVARDQADFGGVVHARLEPHLGRIQVLLRFGAHRVPAGWVTDEQIGRKAFEEVTRIYRRGGVADCPVQIIPRVAAAEEGGGFDVWLNPDQAARSAHLATQLRPA